MSPPFDRVVKRQVRITRKRPGRPRELLFEPISQLVTWKPPAEQTLFTHYFVRVNTDIGPPAFSFPRTQQSLAVPTSCTIYISSYNDTNNQESAPASLAVTVEAENSELISKYGTVIVY